MVEPCVGPRGESRAKVVLQRVYDWRYVLCFKNVDEGATSVFRGRLRRVDSLSSRV